MNKHLNEILMEDDVVLQQPLVLEGLSQHLASHSAGLIARYAREEQPFFLYHSFAHVHEPMFTVPQMAGKSAHGKWVYLVVFGSWWLCSDKKRDLNDVLCILVWFTILHVI